MKKLFAILALLLLVFDSNAGHIRGGVITYEHVSAKKYTVYAHIWRDCSGIQISASNLKVYNDTFGLVGTISTQTKISAKDISLYDTSSSCNSNYSCSSVGGFEEHTWKMTVDFANYSGCEFYLTWDQFGRTTSVTTGSANENFLIDTYINLCYDTLGRSVLKDGYPAMNVMHNRDWLFNPGLYDRDDYFDSVSFSLVNGLKGINSSISYSGNFNAQRPLTFFGFPNQNLNWPAGLRLDPLLGTLAFRPTQNNQIGPVVIMHKGWKKVNDTMRMVGYARYDFTPSVLSSTMGSVGIYHNMSPSLHYVCENQTTCFEMFFENTMSNAMELSYFLDDSSIQVDTLQWQADSIRLRVCFTPDSNHLLSRAYRIISDARANVCPWVLKRNFTHGFMVVPAPDSSKFPSWDVSRSCNQLKISVADTASSGKSGYAKADSGSYVKDTLIHTLQEQDTGWFRFQVMQDWVGCQVVFEDSVYIDSLYHYSSASILPVKACADEQLVLHALGSGGLGIQSILWGDSSTLDSFSIFINRDTTVALRMLDSSGCFSVDTFDLTMNPTFSGSVPELGICTELPTGTLVLSAAVSGGTQPYVFNWLGLGSGNNYTFSPPMMDTSIVLELIDSVNCRFYDTLDIDRYIPNYPLVNPDTVGCFIGFIDLKPVNKLSGTFQWNGYGLSDSIRFYPPVGSHQKILRYQDSLGCNTYDTVNILNHAKPNMNLPPDTVICAGQSIRIDPVIYSGIRPFVYEWLPYTSLNDSFVHDVFYQSSRIYLKLTDSTNCYRVDSLDVLINSIPQIRQHSPYSVCTRDSMVSLSPLSGTLNGVWLGTGISQINGDYWLDTRNLSVESHYFSFESLNGSGNCTAKESLEIIIHPSPSVDAGLDTGLCGGGPLVFRATASGGTMPYSFVWNDDSSEYLDSIVHFLNSDTLFHIALSDSNGCLAYDTVSGYFYTIPTSSILRPSQDTSLCDDKVLFIEGDTNSTNGVNAVYQFNYGIQNRSNIIPDSSFTLRYSALSTQGCSADDSLRISMLKNPIITNITYSSVCEDEGDILLDSLATPYGGAWIGKGVWTDSLSFYFKPDASGTGVFGIGYLLVDSTTGCFDSASTFVSVEEKTMVDFTADSTVGIAPMTSTFTNNSIGGLQFNFLWYFGDGDSSIMAQPTHTYTVPGFYDVQFQVSGNHCYSSLVKTNYIQVDTNTTDLAQGDFGRIQLYPNPNTGHLFLKDFPQGANFKVYDALGREVEFHFNLLSGSLAEIRLEKSMSGAYMIEIFTAEKRWMQVFVVE